MQCTCSAAGEVLRCSPPHLSLVSRRLFCVYNIALLVFVGSVPFLFEGKWVWIEQQCVASYHFFDSSRHNRTLFVHIDKGTNN